MQWAMPPLRPADDHVKSQNAKRIERLERSRLIKCIYFQDHLHSFKSPRPFFVSLNRGSSKWFFAVAGSFNMTLEYRV